MSTSTGSYERVDVPGLGGDGTGTVGSGNDGTAAGPFAMGGPFVFGPRGGSGLGPELQTNL